jgi:hypothetical protein
MHVVKAAIVDYAKALKLQSSVWLSTATHRIPSVPHILSTVLANTARSAFLRAMFAVAAVLTSVARIGAGAGSCSGIESQNRYGNKQEDRDCLSRKFHRLNLLFLLQEITF